MSDPLSEAIRTSTGDRTNATDFHHSASSVTSNAAAERPTLSGQQGSARGESRRGPPPPSWQSVGSGGDGCVTLLIVGPDGNKSPLRIRLTDDVSTLRALVTQMHDTADWTTQTDRREDRKEFSDWTDEDTGFAEVIALEAKPHEQAIAPASWRNPRSWLEWNDKRGKLRMMCGAYHLADGKPLSYYDIVDGSTIHPLYERYGDAIDAGAKMLADPDWYSQQGQQARALANKASAYLGYSASYFSSEVCAGDEREAAGASSGTGSSWSLGGGASSKFTQYFVWPGPLVDHTPSTQADTDNHKSL